MGRLMQAVEGKKDVKALLGHEFDEIDPISMESVYLGVTEDESLDRELDIFQVRNEIREVRRNHEVKAKKAGKQLLRSMW
ncbi:hypothetical protein LJC19_04860 [Oxalobacter sp. OttesenSCG-928-P03]|nr:hypothetical protein [Oxalobacter sp. OttesenSCG-928-P03]